MTGPTGATGPTGPAGGGAACPAFSTAVFVDGGTSVPLIDQNGSACAPYATIQQGIDATTPTIDWTIVVASGTYSEDLVIPSDRRITMVSMGRVLLGAIGDGNIAWTTGGEGENYLQLTTWSSGLGNVDFGAGVDKETAGWRVAGTITITGTVTFTLVTDHVDLAGAPTSIDATGATFGWLFPRFSIVEGVVDALGILRVVSPLMTTFLDVLNVIDVQNALYSEFDGDLNTGAGESGVFTSCIFGGGVTLNNGIFDLDGVTYDTFVLLGNSFGAGAFFNRADLPYEGSVNTAGATTVDPTAPVVFVDTSGGPLTIQLPPTPLVNDECKVMDDTGDSATNPITVDGNGNTIDGAATDVIAVPYGVRHYKFGGSIPEWKVIGCCSGVITPARIFGANLQQWVRADDLANGAVSAWNDRTANANNFAQAVGADQPIKSATGGPNSTAEVTFDGVNDYLTNATLNLPAPGTQPYYFFAVVKQITWASGLRLCQSADIASASAIIFQDGASPQLAMFNSGTANDNPGDLLGTYKIVEAQFTNSTSDYLQVGSTNKTGQNAGNNDPASNGINLCATSVGTQNGHMSICEWGVVFANVTALQRELLRDYLASRYGASVAT